MIDTEQVTLNLTSSENSILIRAEDDSSVALYYHANADINMLLTRKEAAEYLRLKPVTLAIWSHKRTGQLYYKAGGKVLLWQYLNETIS